MRSVFVFPQGDLEEVERLLTRLGRVPEWSVVCDVSGRDPGDAEIAGDRVVDGLRFFDYRTSFERSRGL